MCLVRRTSLAVVFVCILSPARLTVPAFAAPVDDPVADLARALTDDNALVRKRAALALERLGPAAAPAAAALRTALADADPDVRAAAAAALRSIGGPLSKEELLQRLKDKTQAATVRIAACRDLAERFAADPVVPGILEALLADPVMKLEAARALEALEKRPRLARINRGVTLKGHTGPVLALAFSPDGKTLVSVGGVTGEPGEIRLWDLASHREIGTWKGHAEAVTAVGFHPDGSVLATACGVRDHGLDRCIAGEVRLWDFPSGRELAVWQAHRRQIAGLAFGVGGKILATAGEDRIALAWDVTAPRKTPLFAFKGHFAPLSAVAAAPDRKVFATAGHDAAVRLWDATTGEEKLLLRGHGGPVPCIAFSPDGKTLAAGGGVYDSETASWTSGEARIWDLASGKERLTLRRHADAITAVTFAPDGLTVVTGGADAMVKIWDANTGKERQALPGHTSRVTAVAFSADGKTLATASDDRTVKLWEVIREKGSR